MLSGTDVAGQQAIPAEHALAGADRLVRFAVILTLALAALRLAVAGNFDLFMDEAYYWVWSQRLVAGYYDHPPLVAYFIRGGTMIFGDTELGVRFFGILAGAADAFLVYGIMHALTANRRIAAWAMMLMAVSTVSVLSVMTVPDQPMILFWLGAFYALARIARGGRPAWWLLVGLMGGLAAASKLTTLFLALAVPLWLALVPSLRVWFRRPWIYAAGAIAVLVFLPVLLWNAANDWAAFVVQYDRSNFDPARSTGFLEYLGVVAAMIGPVAIFPAAAGLAASFRGGAWRTPVAGLLVAASLPLAVYLGIHSFSEAIGPHWVAPIVIVAAMLGGIGVEDVRGRRGRWARIVAVCRKIVVPFGVLITVVFYGLATERFLPIPLEYDFTERFRGWDAFAANAEAARIEAEADYILAPDYAMYSMLRFYSPKGAPIYPFGDRERWDHFGDLAVIGPEGAAMRGLYVAKWNQWQAVSTLAPYFAGITQVGRIDRPIRTGTRGRQWIFVVEDPLPAADPMFGARGD